MFYLLLRISFVVRSLHFLGSGDHTVLFSLCFFLSSTEHFTVAMTNMTKVMSSVWFDAWSEGMFRYTGRGKQISFMLVLTCLTKLTVARERITNVKAINTRDTVFASEKGYYNLEYCWLSTFISNGFQLIWCQWRNISTSSFAYWKCIILAL